MNRQQMIKRIKAITAGFREAPEASSAPVDKATKLALTIKGKMGGVGSAQELAMVALLSETAGVDVLSAYNRLPNPNRAFTWNKAMMPLVAVVPLTAYNSHNAPVGSVVVVLDSYAVSGGGICRSVSPSGTVTNNILNATPEQLRLATDEEIDRLTLDQVDYFIRLYTR